MDTASFRQAIRFNLHDAETVFETHLHSIRTLFASDGRLISWALKKHPLATARYCPEFLKPRHLAEMLKNYQAIVFLHLADHYPRQELIEIARQYPNPAVQHGHKIFTDAELIELAHATADCFPALLETQENLDPLAIRLAGLANQIPQTLADAASRRLASKI